MLASTLSRPRWAMPMVTSSRPAWAAASQISSTHRDRWSRRPRGRTASGRRTWSAGRSRRPRPVELLQDPQLLLARRLGVRALDPLLDPAPLLGVHDVHVLDAGGAAVGVAQDAEDVAQLHEAASRAAELAGRELAVEVPQGQAVRLDPQVGVAALLVLERVGVGHQVTADPVGVDQLQDPGLLVDLVVVRRRDVGVPADRLVGDPQRPEDARRRSRPRRAAAGGPASGTRRTARPG